MHNKKLFRQFSVTALTLLLTTGMLADAVAEPPPWAPAHGYRAKKHGHHKHYSEHRQDYYGILDGHCNRQAIGAVVGGTAGGIIGHEADDGGEIGTIAGAVVGVIIGSMIGKSMDEADRHCAGSAFEYAPDRQPVRWQDPAGRDYVLTPYNTRVIDDRYCRNYTMETVLDSGRRQEVQGLACRQGDGEWRIVGN